MRVTKIVTFAYGHRLSNYGGKCKMLHGHNARLEATIETATLNNTGFVIDFGDLKMELEKIKDIFDHRLLLKDKDPLNKKIANTLPEDWIFWFDVNPTAENIATFIANQLARNIVCDKIIIKLWETDTSFAEYVLPCKT